MSRPQGKESHDLARRGVVPCPCCGGGIVFGVKNYGPSSTDATEFIAQLFAAGLIIVTTPEALAEDIESGKADVTMYEEEG